ncbi:P-granule-associated novel protein 1-like [Aphidius gifuensis]|uniref:P-granule-associated novel protein 1-like n=1 Tax=Aphidius gifuensis TaxID=684658 RepID=UPI001CDCC919|nr:P-granule-associated novel protein 1-like [Aphidius gifuensis]
MEILTRQSFMCLKSLQHLTITEKKIDDGALTIDNKKLSLLNLSYNSLEIIGKESLISLEIPIRDSWASYNMHSCELLSNITSLQSFSIFHHKSVDVCHGTCEYKKFKIVNLRYVSGTFKNLRPMIFLCLNKLENLGISEGSLEIIETGAFTGLEKLTQLTLESNRIKHINQNIFSPLKNLIILILKNNTIEFIDDKAFVNKNLTLLDLSHNLLTHIRENTFFGVTLKNLRQWAVSNLKIDITCENKGWMIEICKNHNSISSVKSKLENLELTAGSVILKANLFGFLPSLKYLKIQVDETFIFFSQTLKNLKNLKTVEIVGNRTIGICQNLYSKNISNSIIDIRYTTGSIHSLRANSFDCLPQIEILTITKTQATRYG